MYDLFFFHSIKISAYLYWAATAQIRNCQQRKTYNEYKIAEMKSSINMTAQQRTLSNYKHNGD